MWLGPCRCTCHLVWSTYITLLTFYAVKKGKKLFWSECRVFWSKVLMCCHYHGPWLQSNSKLGNLKPGMAGIGERDDTNRRSAWTKGASFTIAHRINSFINLGQVCKAGKLWDKWYCLLSKHTLSVREVRITCTLRGWCICVPWWWVGGTTTTWGRS